MPKHRGKLVLSTAEREQLQQLIRAQSTPQGLAQRARVVQLAAQGLGVRAIGERVGMHFNQVAKWSAMKERPAVWTFREGKIWGNSKIFFGRNFLLVSKDRCV